MSTLACPLRENALHTPDAPALIAPDRVFSYAELDACVEEAAGQLAERGHAAGNSVVMTGEPGAERVKQLLAALRLGRIVCIINPKFPDEYVRKLISHIAENANLEEDPTLALPARGEGICPLRTGDHKRASSQAVTAIEFDEDQPATIVFTSGSTGGPKAAMHSIGNHLHSARLSNQNIPLGPGDRWLLSLPLFHVAGIGVVFRCLVGGAAIAIPAPGAPLADAIRDTGATHVSLVSTQLLRFLRSGEGVAALQPLKAILLGGSGMPEPLIREAHERGLRIHTSYGMTETSSQVTATRPGDSIEKLLTSGAPLDPDSLRIGDGGEIQVRGETLFLGYLQGKETHRPLTPDGWFATGDLGALDAKGYLCVTGRKDNMFIAGGENIQPEEVEAALCKCPGVLDAIVTPVTHLEFGVVPVAFVRCASGVPDEKVLRNALASVLPRFKIPRRILAWPEDIVPAGFKPDRRALAAHAEKLLSVESPLT